MRIALIHAVFAAIEPIARAFDRHWPGVERMNLLDDALSVDRAAGRETAGRIVALAHHAQDAGADGILYTCSAFGPAIAAAAGEASIPVLKPNEAMFAEALAYGRVGLLASFQPSLPPMTDEFAALGSNTVLETRCVPKAMEALNAGDPARHDALLVEEAGRFGPVDAIMLAQFSTARAAPLVAEATGLPVLTSPDSAVLALKGRLG